MSNKNNQGFPEYMDYHAMRKAGLEYVQKLSGKIWTDYNLHDPGVTILELLCYALADLGFRTSFKMPDLLTQSDNTASEASLIPPHEILSSAPITTEDYRKLILENVPGIKNVDFIKSNDIIKYANREIKLNGRYKVLLELDNELNFDEDYAKRCRNIVARNASGQFDKSDKDIKQYYKSYIKNLLAKHRNLCENFTSVEFVKEIPVWICSHIEVKPYADLKKILSEFYQKLEEYVSPSIKHYSLQEMLEKGKTLDEIFQIQKPKYGFIDKDELYTYKRKKVLYNSDVINILMSIDGVISVPHFQFMEVEDEYKTSVTKSEHSISLVDNDSAAWRFCDIKKNRIIWEINGIDFPNPEEIELEGKADDKQYDIELKKPEGRYRKTDVYYSIQNFFPKNYKLGTEGISSLESNSRKAERMQLKAYLMFFDQLMGDYLMQLSSFSKMFSHQDYKNARTYFTKVLTNKEIVDVESLLEYKEVSGNHEDYFDGEHTYSEVVEDEKVKQDRYSRVLDHLLARFNEKFVDYSLFKINEDRKINEDSKLTMSDDQIRINSINDKVWFLDNYPKYSANRSLGVDYTEDWALTSLERLILSKLGIDRLRGQANCLATEQSKKASATYDKYFGLHIIEHPLLSLIYGNNTTVDSPYRFLDLSLDKSRETKSADSYSMQVTVVVPGWLKICEDRIFRDIVEKTIRQEIPAHISAKICWISHDMMKKTEDAYKKYLSSLKTLPYSDITGSNNTKAISDALSEMIEAMYSLYNIYPTVKLVNPNAESASNGECIRLGFTALPNVERKTQVEIPDADKSKFVYTGKEQTYKIADSELYTVKGNKQTSPGNYKVLVSLNDTEKYEWSDGTTEPLSYNFVINAKEIAIPKVSTKDFTYDGKPKSLTIAANSAYTVSGNSGVDAGNYTVTLSLTDPTNTVWSNGTTEDIKIVMNITKAQIEIPAADNTVFIYTGKELTYNIAKSAYYTVKNNKETQIGNYVVLVSLNDTKNFEWSNGTIDDLKYDFTILEKSLIPGTQTVEELVKIPFSFEFIAGGKDQNDGNLFISKVTKGNPNKGDGEINIFKNNKVTVELAANMGIDSKDNEIAIFEIAYRIKESAIKGAVADDADSLYFFASQKLSIKDYQNSQTKALNNNGKKYRIEETPESFEIICEQTKFSATFPMEKKNYGWNRMSNKSSKNMEEIPDSHSWIKAESLYVLIDGKGSEIENGNLGVKGEAFCILKIKKTVVTKEIVK
ncbi:MAG: hypothetical protein J6Y11_04465 [Paludibacteraceae bacterium]|nr:hypothetical protein [Paludibacteraceae bacterium]